jgi:hypothetical protein
LGMGRSGQRHLGARRSACRDAERCSEREFIAELVWAHFESIALVRTLLVSRECADGSRADADHAAAVAADNPADRRANEWAIEAAALARAAHVAHQCATDEWASHVMRLQGLMAMTDELYCNPVTTPRREAQTAAAPMALVRFRSRDDCIGRPGWPPRQTAG